MLNQNILKYIPKLILIINHVENNLPVLALLLVLQIGSLHQRLQLHFVSFNP